MGFLVWGLMWGASPARGGEFYSWIDASGTMVITDDPGQIPPAENRSSVFLHQFEERSQVAVKREFDEPASDRPPTKASPEGVPKEEVSSPEKPLVNPAEAELPPIVVDQPEEKIKDWYRWIPLTTPLYSTRGAISGYWCHQSVTSPEDAFQRFLRQQRAGLANQGPFVSGAHRREGGGFKGPLGSRSGHAIYNQVIRERQALMERSFMQFPSQGPPSRSSTHGLPGASRGGRASAR